MKTKNALPKFAKPLRGLRAWTTGALKFGHATRHLTARRTAGPKEPFIYWHDLYGVKVMDSSRRLRRLIWRTWLDVLDASNRTNWNDAAATVSIANYRDVLKVPNGFQLFAWHHFFNSNLEIPSGFPFNWDAITFQYDPPDPYVLPAKPHITALTETNPDTFTVSVDNWPEDGNQVCLTSIQRLTLIQGKGEKTRRFTGKTASGTGTDGEGTLTIDPLYPWQDPPTGATFRFGLRYRKVGEGSQTKSPTVAAHHFYTGQTPWEDIDNVFVSDENYTTADLLQTSGQWYPHTDGLWATGFGFTLPQDAIPKGIKVRVQRKDTNEETNYLAINLLLNGTYAGAGQQNDDPWPANEAYVELGGPTDLWGTAWTADNINDPTFGCELFGQIYYPDAPPPPYREGFAAIDHAEIIVYYTLNQNIPSNPTFYDWTRPDP
jgi:hypothetical protein